MEFNFFATFILFGVERFNEKKMWRALKPNNSTRGLYRDFLVNKGFNEGTNVDGIQLPSLTCGQSLSKPNSLGSSLFHSIYSRYFLVVWVLRFLKFDLNLPWREFWWRFIVRRRNRFIAWKRLNLKWRRH